MRNTFKKPKRTNWRARSPIARGPWRAKMRGYYLRFFNIDSVVKHQKIEGVTLLGKLFPEKSSTMPKATEREDPLVSPGIVCYEEKKENLFDSVCRPNGSISHLKI